MVEVRQNQYVKNTNTGMGAKGNDEYQRPSNSSNTSFGRLAASLTSPSLPLEFPWRCGIQKKHMGESNRPYTYVRISLEFLVSKHKLHNVTAVSIFKAGNGGGDVGEAGAESDRG